MIACGAGKGIVIASQEGSVVTRMLTDMDGAGWVRFADDSLRGGRRKALGRR